MGKDLGKELAHVICAALTKKDKGSFLDGDGILWRWVDNELIGKPAVQTKDLRHIWVEEAIKTPELIDDRYYNLDGSRKHKTKIEE